jgi:hypothetical protein
VPGLLRFLQLHKKQDRQANLDQYAPNLDRRGFVAYDPKQTPAYSDYIQLANVACEKKS